jgi:hypothetical protein
LNFYCVLEFRRVQAVMGREGGGGRDLLQYLKYDQKYQYPPILFTLTTAGTPMLQGEWPECSYDHFHYGGLAFFVHVYTRSTYCESK